MKTNCIVCGKPVSVSDFCGSCAMKKAWQKKIRPSCSVKNCLEKHFAKGFCAFHYRRLRNFGTTGAIKVPDLPGEEWRDINNTKCIGLKISNLGRVKSCRKRDEKILKLKMQASPSRQSIKTFTNATMTMLVHMEVLRAFHPNLEGDFRAVFIDGDRENCRADNLRWYGRQYLVEKAIQMADESTYPLASNFKLFWLGNGNALNDWFENQLRWIGPYLRRRLDIFLVPYYIDVDDRAQEVILQVFLSLRRGMIRELTDQSLRAFIRGIANNVLAEGIKNLLPTVYIEWADEDGECHSILDKIGWCNPSAELEAIYRQEGNEFHE